MGGGPPPHPSRPIGSVKCDYKAVLSDGRVIAIFSSDGTSLSVTMTAEQAEYYSEGQSYLFSIA